MKIIKKQQNKDIIQNDLKITKTNHLQGANGITLIALVITIVLNSSYLAMARMNRFEKI